MKGTIFSEDYSHIVVLPDLHGDARATIHSLWLAYNRVSSAPIAYDLFESTFLDPLLDDQAFGPNLIVPSSNRVALVQLGDLVDRGPLSEACIRIIFSVEALLGWETFPLYGNHEIMSFLGKSHTFVHPDDYSSFGGRHNRESAFSPHGGRLFDMLPAQLLGMVRLDGPGLTSTLFVHGGIELEWIHDMFQTYDVDMINEFVQAMVQHEDGLEALNDLNNSFLWTRKFAKESICDGPIDEVLEAFSVFRIVLGHIPQRNKRVNLLCGGKVVLADAKMSHWMDNHKSQPVALIFTMNDFSQELASIVAHYANEIGHSEEVVLYKDEVPAPSPSGANLLWLLADVATHFLSSTEV